VVLMLAPEVYLPLRQVGTHFHASSDGVAAAQEAFALLETPLAPRGTAPCPDLRTTTIAWHDVSVQAPGRDRWAPRHLTAAVRPGRVLALTGPSGTGKTTAVGVLLGLVAPDLGAIVLTPTRTPTEPVDPATVRPAEVDLADVDPASWWNQLTWVSQRPVLLPGTVRENVLGDSGGKPPPAPVSDEDIARAAATTGFDGIVATLPHGWDTVIGHGGVGLSVGQRQRLALTRALLRTSPLVILDEPTAHLDAESEAQITDALRALRAAGRTVVVIAHRRAVLEVADDVVEVGAAEIAGVGSTTRVVVAR
jgi:ATP-binding cassette subfamily C protein CydD